MKLTPRGLLPLACCILSSCSAFITKPDDVNVTVASADGKSIQTVKGTITHNKSLAERYLGPVGQLLASFAQIFIAAP